VARQGAGYEGQAPSEFSTNSARAEAMPMWRDARGGGVQLWWATFSSEWLLRTERTVPLRDRMTIDSVYALVG
jgi:hypothetical protein